MRAWRHFQTITYHRKLVRQGCFRVGLYWQGLTHDLSKYSPTEFMVGVLYFQGDRSPNNAEREDKGVSTSWLHHKGRNKHHFEYWVDYNVNGKEPILVGTPMPTRYIIEMFMDRIAACRVYQKENYTDKSPLVYHQKGKHVHILMHQEGLSLLDKLLQMLADEGEEKTFAYVKEIVKQDKKERRRSQKYKVKESRGN